jgi:hypothetical protein
MKTRISFVIAALMLLGTEAFATIHTVSNDSNKPAQYTDVQSAINASTTLAGDTIYVSGTQYLYPDFTITKKLVLIGGGYSSGNQFNLITQVNYVYVYRDAGTNDASGTVISGFRINSQLTYSNANTSLSVTNIRLFRNWIGNLYTQYVSTSNWTIYNNIFTSYLDGAYSSSNFIIQNNIFIRCTVDRFNQSSVVIDHNYFIHGGDAFDQIQYATITNNIITSSDNTRVMSPSVNYCTFNSNLSLTTNISSSSPAGSFIVQVNSGGNNIVGSDPMFTSVADFNNFSASNNYRLQSGSPGHNAGTDGTDIGIYGGTYPFPSGGAAGGGYDMSALPPIPQISSMNIQNASVLPGAQLKVSVQATVNN